MRFEDRIEMRPDVLCNKPFIKGTRISVEFILELLANGWDFEEIIENYPQLTREDILASIEYSLNVLKSQKAYAP
ncbi:MAG: DUF433 domain-containing protein [Aquificae bacterium]|nr:DUF433 domain-containing protein [Aquificota bacterium]